MGGRRARRGEGGCRQGFGYLYKSNGNNYPKQIFIYFTTYEYLPVWGKMYRVFVGFFLSILGIFKVDIFKTREWGGGVDYLARGQSLHCCYCCQLISNK